VGSRGICTYASGVAHKKAAVCYGSQLDIVCALALRLRVRCANPVSTKIINKAGNICINVILRRVRATLDAVEKQ